MAKEAGVGQSTVAQTLNDGYSPRLDNVFKYLDALNTITGEKYTLCDLNPD
jgi:DNA-binding phage protein